MRMSSSRNIIFGIIMVIGMLWFDYIAYNVGQHIPDPPHPCAVNSHPDTDNLSVEGN